MPISPLDDLRVEDWGGDDRHQHQRRAVRHRRSAACLPQAEFRTFR
jgi:hypothetical protein